MKCMWLLVFVFIIIAKCFASQLKQEAATVDVCNPKYFTECYAITKRTSRGQPYTSNFTAITKHTWANNLTMRVVVHSAIPIEVVKTKLCDIPKTEWLYDFVRTYSNILDCPYKPGLYMIHNMVFPPRHLPPSFLSLLTGQFYVKFALIITKTEEIILECSIKFKA